MPIYEYRCDACNSEFEALQKISDQPLAECRQCGAADPQKLISAAGFRLKGAGWYETDFKTGKKKNLSGSKTDASGKSSDSAKA